MDFYNFNSVNGFLLTNAFPTQPKTTPDSGILSTTAQSFYPSSPIAQIADRGFSRFLKPVNTLRIGEATSDLATLQEFAAEDPAPAGYAFATGSDAGVFAAEMEGERGGRRFQRPSCTGDHQSSGGRS